MGLQYHIETADHGYCVIDRQKTVAIFNVLEDAIDAMREFEQKRFPKNWQKTPPATRYAKQKYYDEKV
ncbi:MAG: hypothetical protein R3219_02235 [Hydrogenovibrio sp.]|nr:hypothetical protein [Hydrogenovibrio sp.]